jgi:hypothetical protein
MDDATRDKMFELGSQIGSGINEVDAAIESGEDEKQFAAARQVAELSQKYNALLAQVSGPDRDEMERRLGRRLMDLRRAADGLKRLDSGQKAKVAVDAGAVPFLLRRDPPKSIVPERAAPNGKLSVGSEVESWCGKCKEMREHHIVAMVGGEPKQVICVVCSSRHNFRTDPPEKSRRAVATATPGVTDGRRVTAEDRELQKRQEQKRQLQKELAEAAAPRPFDPKGRYKAGEIIVHPEHGKGKIENVLRSSMLVRFLDGLRPVDLS